MIFLLNLLLKRWTRRRQEQWAEAFAEKVKPALPEGVECHVRGWWPGCEPFFNWRELNWIEVEVRPHERMAFSRQFTMAMNPTPSEVLAAATELHQRIPTALA
jgi:hypothetical protein